MARRNSRTASQHIGLEKIFHRESSSGLTQFKNYLNMKKFQMNKQNRSKLNFSKTQSAYGNNANLRLKKGAHGKPPANHLVMKTNLDIEDYLNHGDTKTTHLSMSKLNNIYRNQFKEIK